MKYGIATSNRALAERIFKVLENKLDTASKTARMSRDSMYASDDSGNCIQWVRPTESVRGHKFDKVYVDMTANTDFAFNTVLCMAWRHGFNDILWVTDKRMALYGRFIEHLHPSLKLIDTEEDQALDFYQLKYE